MVQRVVGIEKNKIEIEKDEKYGKISSKINIEWNRNGITFPLFSIWIIFRDENYY